ncbi:MAG: hypothetical protein BAJALOKI1v1_640021 [Promethearchaeota archaeon]|nr:MAG: hypothetical protein BAJALOKI1v1_640021 [Candidatus Lokiarchaeota archaeon]
MQKGVKKLYSKELKHMRTRIELTITLFEPKVLECTKVSL